MANSSRLNETFGTEIEFILAFLRTREWELWHEAAKAQGLSRETIRLAERNEKTEARRAIITSLREAGFTVNDHGLADSTRWSVESDGSVDATDKEKENRSMRFANAQQRPFTEDEWKRLMYCSVEVKSCVLPFNANSLLAVELAVQTIVRNHSVYVNESCGLHVHVGNQTLGFPIQTVKTFATLVTCFEKQFNQLHAEHRLKSNYSVLETTAFHPQDRDPWQIAQTIDGCRNLEDIINRFGRDRNDPELIKHHWCYNFNNLLFREDRRTIEFRQHQGTLDSAAIIRWIKFACISVSIAHRVPKEVLWKLILEAAASDPEWDILMLLQKLDQPGLAASFRSHYIKHRPGLKLYDSFL
ncbi:hypothetical protein MMC30_002030 [Trapelia coarctata]|nr:hypothetical protein [Trapelia coarctata]